MLVRSTTRLAASAAAAERLDAIANLPPAIAEPADPQTPATGGRMSLDNVRFGRDGRATVLDGVSLVVESGERIALRGASGSGKSTIAQLMVRLLDPQGCTVRLNGIDLRRMTTAELRRQVALMTQDAPVFNDTVRANLAIGNAAADDAALWAVLGRVGLAVAVRTLPGGLDAVLGEAGRTLSAGQARRICLARALLSPAAILVLDEPTAGLDAEAETAFFADLPAIAGDRTVVLITHASLPAGTVDRELTLLVGHLAA